MRRFVLAFAILPIALGGARLLYSGPEDIYAFPKYRVTFLNDLPVANETAQRWIQNGLRGGEQEFLGEPWYSQPSTKEIDSSETGTFHESPNACTFTITHGLAELTFLGRSAVGDLCLFPPAHENQSRQRVPLPHSSRT